MNFSHFPANTDDTDLIRAIRSQFIMSITDEKGIIIEVNELFCKISQYSVDELIGQNHRVINSGVHDKAFFADMWRTISAGNSWRGEICNSAKDGTLYWVDSVITPLHDIHGKIDRYISIRNDITRRKTQEQELVKSNKLLDGIGKVAGVGGWEVNLSTMTVYWSNETRRIHGVDDDFEPTLENVIEFYAPEARQVVRSAVEHGIATGEDWDLEVPFIRANGERIWVRAVGSVEFEKGKATKLVGAFQDISERYIQKEKIERNSIRMSLATESGGIGVWEFDLINNALKWDKRMYCLYGLEYKDSIEPYELWTSHVHPDDLPRTEEEVEKAFKGTNKFDAEFRVVWPNGEIRHIRGSGIVERDASYTPIRMTGVNWDVTEIRETAAELAKKNSFLQVTLDSIGDAVITTDAQGIIQWLNPVAENLTGWSKSEATGRPLEQVFKIISEETRVKAASPLDACLLDGAMSSIANDTLLISKSGEEFGIEDSASPIRTEKGEILGVVLVFHDVTEQRRLSGEISYRAKHDPLTDLVNRTEFECRLNRLLKDIHSEKAVHALLYIDLDQFKIVNDTCGHAIGDKALIEVSKLFRAITRGRDTLARLGGDEFGVILEHCNEAQASRVAQSICDKMDDYRFHHSQHRFRIGASIGMVEINDAWSSSALLMQAADKACFAAKGAGRNRVYLYSDSDEAISTIDGEMQWTTRIESALDNDGFSFYFQKIVDAKNATQTLHIEILLRMIEGETVISPGAFILAAERFHLASRIDKWVIRRVCAWINELGQQSLARINMISINVSGQSIGDRTFHDFVAKQLKALPVTNRKKLCFEITETAAISNITDASLFIEHVKKLGSQIALDDFGAGASSFGYLRNLDVDIIKIDGQFIQNLLRDPLDEAAVEGFINVAKVANLKTVAEFVDQKALYDRVNELGIDYMQGFLLHQPQSLKSIFNR